MYLQLGICPTSDTMVSELQKRVVTVSVLGPFVRSHCEGRRALGVESAGGGGGGGGVLGELRLVNDR